MKEKKALEENLRETIRSLLSLCPAYNPVSFWLRSLKNAPIAEAVKFHPELLREKPLRVLIELFGIEIRNVIEYKKDSLGERILQLADSIEETFEDERIRKSLEESLEIKLEKTPAQDYVEMCTEALANDKISIRILQEISQSGPIELEDLRMNLEKKFGMRCTRDEILERLRKIRSLGILSNFEISKMEILERYKKYLSSWRGSTERV